MAHEYGKVLDHSSVLINHSFVRHGFLLIDKPLGQTSHDAVAIVRRTLPERSIGHLGTLDPAATGLLVLAVGKKALKVVELFGDVNKEYEADVLFGKISSTYDREGIIEDFPIGKGWVPPEQGELQRVIADRFIGKISQVPPAHSAIKIGGERAYRKARQGVAVDMPTREVHIENITIVSYAFPKLTLRVRCGSGTYIRSLAHDLGQVLRCGGYLSALRRTKVAAWSVTDAVAPDRAAWTNVMPLKDVLKDLPSRELSQDEYEELRMGRNIEAEVTHNMVGWCDDLPVALLIPAADGTAHARKVF
jgi:tRNA pseudouridine55 synthase